MSYNKSDKACRILLIDDEPALLNALTVAIESDGFVCANASSAEKALSILDNTASIELIVSDIKMPLMDGITLLHHVRERYKERPWLQVIFVTAYATLENSVEALRLAATDFLYKPVRREVLLTSVRSALDKASEIRQGFEFRTQGSNHLDRLAQELQALKGLLTSPAASSPEKPQTDKTEEQKPFTRERFLSLIQSNEIKKKIFKDDLFSDPVWNMLLELMQHELQGQNAAASSLYFSSGAPMSTASRRLAEMESAGLIERKIDEHDKRRQIVKIKPETYRLIEAYFRAINDL